MTETEMIADVVVAAVRAATAPIQAKCTELKAQIQALEQRAAVPGPPGPQGERGERGDTGPKGDDGVGVQGPPGRDGADGKDAPAIDLDDVAQLAAALVPAGKDGKDGRDGQPGVPGAPGRDGATGERGEKGLDGKDGRNGTVDDLRFKLVPVSERSFQLYAGDGVPIEGGLITLDVPLYKGVYVSGTSYAKGDCVTFGSSLWIARDATTEKPGDGATRWQLAVKKGSDGREGKPGKDGERGPKGERGDPGRNFT